MDNYRKKIKNSLFVNVIFIVVACLIILFFCSFRKDMLSNSHASEFTGGFRMGIFSTVIVMAIINIVNYFKALHNAEKLNEMYVKENDERECLIQQKAFSMSYVITIYILAIAMIISSFISISVFITLVCVIFFFSFTKVAFLSYFHKRY